MEVNPDDWPDQTSREKSRAIREKLKGTCMEFVHMREGRVLWVQTVTHLPGGGIAEGESNVDPGNEIYDELMREHGPLEPGEHHVIKRKLIDGEWVRLPDSEVYLKPEEMDDQQETP